VRLVGADHSGWAALGPANNILARNCIARRRMDDTTGDVADCKRGLVEWHAMQWDAAVANRAQNHAGVQRFECAGSFGAQAAVATQHKLVLFDLDCLDLAEAVTYDLNWRNQVAHADGSVAGPIGTSSVLAQDLDILQGDFIFGQAGLALLIQLQVGWLDD